MIENLSLSKTIKKGSFFDQIRLDQIRFLIILKKKKTVGNPEPLSDFYDRRQVRGRTPFCSDLPGKWRLSRGKRGRWRGPARWRRHRANVEQNRITSGLSNGAGAEQSVSRVVSSLTRAVFSREIFLPLVSRVLTSQPVVPIYHFNPFLPILRHRVSCCVSRSTHSLKFITETRRKKLYNYFESRVRDRFFEFL